MLRYFNLKWASILGFLSVLVSVSKPQTGPRHDPSAESDFDDLVKIFPTPDGIDDSKNSVIIVSTVDGKVSALDVRNGGQLVWSVNVGKGPLVSSSISKLQLKQKGKIIRLIPSLSGELFQFDGKSVEAVPFTADHLLSSSFKVTDDSLLVGGKEVTTFGLDSATGKLLYLCSASGCEMFAEALPGSDVIIVKRRQQTVRSVENRNGHENWNFTVGQVELEISKGSPYKLLEHSGDVEESQDDDLFDEDVDDEEENTSYAASNLIKKIKVLVPEGVFCVFNAAAKKNLNWKHKFESPIANAWYVNGGEHYKIDLFDPRTVPALQDQSKKEPGYFKPTIYMGFYKSQAYIQASHNTENAVTKALQSSTKRTTNPYFQNVKFPYRPYLATTDHLTPATVGEAKEGEIAVYGHTDSDGKCGNALAVYANEEEDVGYYFKSDLSYRGALRESKRKGRGTVEDGLNDSYKDYQIDVVYSSFMDWWKEILIISVTTSIFMQFLIAKIMQLTKKEEIETGKTNSGDYTDAVTDLNPQTPGTSAAFKSRYLQDFEPIQCLGKGGFGVVFESRNKVDDCSYAVKRIRLPNKPAAREKVMREVRALAKLEHPCIVRYFNAWTEEPPQGWQEKTDQQLIADISSCTRTPSMLPSTSLHKESKYTSTQAEMKSKSGNPQLSNLAIGDTGSFSVNHLSKVNSGFQGVSESFDIQFQDSTADQFKNERMEHSKLGKFFQTLSSSEEGEDPVDVSLNESVPFQNYQDDSNSVLFEEKCSKGEHCSSSTDSAIDLAKNGNNFTKRHKRNVSDCAKLPTYEQIYGGKTALAPGIRKRSTSTKPTTDDDEDDTTGSELKAVICRRNSEDDRERKQNETSKLNTSMYLYIQMQLCQKDSLRIWLGNNKDRERPYCLWIFQQVINAVEYVHDCNLIHRDLKPSNIFFTFDGEVKVGDFGLVTEKDDQLLPDNNAFDSSNFDYDISGDGSHTERVGTRLYMAPEQMTSRNYNYKVDIYALGLILIELLTPFTTQMERIRELSFARQCKIRDDFVKKHPMETELVKLMLSHTAAVRPTASDLATHDVFIELEKEEVFLRLKRNRKRTLSKE